MQQNQKKDKGLYSFKNEHDSCGIGFVAHVHGMQSHDIVKQGLEVLINLTHRGAELADSKTGDGAGITIQIPRDFYLIEGINLPPVGDFGTGMIFLPPDEQEAQYCINRFDKICKEEGLSLIMYRDVPVDSSQIGDIARKAEPVIKQVFLASAQGGHTIDIKLYIARKRIEKEINASNLKQKDDFYIPSLSTQVIVFKGMLTAKQLGAYYLDLLDERVKSAIALVHSRFSTNTFPSWQLAQPFRMLAHNGEINTVKGNKFWMSAKESLLQSEFFGDDIQKVFPVIQPDGSDSASFDNALEFFFLAGKSLPHTLAMMIPESWNEKNPIPDDLKAFYEYHATFMEPWDGPASLILTDGRYVGGTLDRNGLRPSRYVLTNDDIMVMGSEVGVQSFEPENIKEKGRLKPGKILLVDTKEGKILYDEELKAELKSRQDYKGWLDKNRIDLEMIDTGKEVSSALGEDYMKYMRAFGFSSEDIDVLIKPMATTGKEPIASMGNDVPLAALSKKPQRLFNYFKQLFAQVTNPAIDPIREELVMTLTGYIGTLHKNLLEETPEHCRMIKFKSPLVTNKTIEIIKTLQYKGFSNEYISMHFNAADAKDGMVKAIDDMCKKAEKAVDDGKNYLILSDRGITEGKAPIPSLIAVSAVHHYLIAKKKRLQVDIVLESAEPREVMHFALLFGYGASIINPYGAFAVINELINNNLIQTDQQKAEENYIHAVNKGVLKVLSKMGTSTLRSYRGAQIFEAIGIDKSVIEKYFTDTVTRIGGIGMEEIADEALYFHNEAFKTNNQAVLPNFGYYKYRRGGERHAWNPETIALLQWATKTNDYNKFKDFSYLINDKKYTDPVFIRDFLEFKRNPVSVEEVESVEEIMKRFVTGAMSYGSISREAHEALAIAMNKIGGKSNTGEGGEDTERFTVRPDGTNPRSAIKQVASGRFGVTNFYLVNADEIQIKIAQGAKPGEGGQLPGHKVDKIIAKTRYSTPGITLISPPPHHDIYSIEDLKQLIFDLKNVNPDAEISVKLVSEAGVGTIAAGVAKAVADRVIISGAEGGTGASPASSIKHAGLPAELGLAETQQTLVINNLREKVRLQTDGQLKTGLDVVLMGLLGAEEFGFATAPLITLGCVMMRKCHLNTCPVGVATQDEELRKRFVGRYQYVMNYFNFVAREVQEWMAQLGVRKFEDLVGRTDLLQVNPKIATGKAKKFDFSKILYYPDEAVENKRYFNNPQQHGVEHVLDRELITLAKPAIEKGEKVHIKKKINNVDRTTGAMLSGYISKQKGIKGLPENTITSVFSGSAGQSFGAWLVKGITFKLEGDANDYIGKGLSGGKIIVYPQKGSKFKPEENIIIGNTVLYGATGGEMYVNGRAGERFCVRNSGAKAVVEGVGDHGCEYMTGGRAVILGSTGRNFAAGMSGGIAYVLNVNGDFDYYCNMGMVELTLVDNLEDMKELRELIMNHYKYTKSSLANEIINNWDEYLKKFIKVIPYEYKKVLEEIKLAAIKNKMVEFEHE